MYGLNTEDEVTVCYSDGSELKGIVKHYPQSAGELWIVETDTALHYIQNFDAIVKKKA